ncbi:MAG: citramalate synthase [Propionibacteriaceae bacterium]|jgi:2-isopropylmalate synthase|nr:citramalate synthase [Propionibacteriaceae bacterium]
MFPTMPEDFDVFDTTLRDGGQQEGIRLTVPDKLRVARLLDDLGVAYIEGGWPGANPNDTDFFEQAKSALTLRRATLVAFGATRRVGLTAATDQLTRSLVDAGTDVVCVVAKSHDRHVRQALKTTLDDNLDLIADTVAFLRSKGKRVFVDAEHYFNGYLDNPDYATTVVHTCAEAGAEVVILCDTNGGMLPSQVADIVEATMPYAPKLGIHAHNDTGCAVANSMAAIEAGAAHVQGTMNGYGERTGNADLTTIIANLEIKFGWPVLPAGNLRDLTRTAHAVADVANQKPFARQPYVGQSSFAHKAGLHASAIRVDADLYQHIDPDLVGNGMRMLISDMAGRANIQIKAEQLGHDLADRELAARVTDRIKAREAEGYSYEAADASFDLLLREALGTRPKFFEVVNWRVHHTSHDELSQATLRVTFDGEPATAYVGEGNGPVNALDQALRAALATRYPKVAEFELADYRVRLLDASHGTDAITRVLIDTEYEGELWTTVGAGGNIIEASWEALVDSIEYGLMAFGEPPSPR